MNTKPFNQRTALVFKHFNRKGYALFAALDELRARGALDAWST